MVGDGVKIKKVIVGGNEKADRQNLLFQFKDLSYI